MADGKVELEKIEEDGVIAWVNKTSEPDILGVGAEKDKGDEYWLVFVSVAEFVREDPLETKFRKIVENALSSIEGVTLVEEEDREVWLVKGNVEGSVLVVSTVRALETIHPELKAYMEEF